MVTRTSAIASTPFESALAMNAPTVVSGCEQSLVVDTTPCRGPLDRPDRDCLPVLIDSGACECNLLANSDGNVIRSNLQLGKPWRFTQLLCIFGLQDEDVIGDLDLGVEQTLFQFLQSDLFSGVSDCIADDSLLHAVRDRTLYHVRVDQSGKLWRGIERITHGLRRPLSHAGWPECRQSTRGDGIDDQIQTAIATQSLQVDINEASAGTRSDVPQGNVPQLAVLFEQVQVLVRRKTASSSSRLAFARLRDNSFSCPSSIRFLVSSSSSTSSRPGLPEPCYAGSRSARQLRI